MRVVVDTNVLVSAALKQQSMPGMAALLVERRGGLLRSLATEEQLFEDVARHKTELWPKEKKSLGTRRNRVPSKPPPFRHPIERGMAFERPHLGWQHSEADRAAAVAVV